jgi:ATP-dependent Clp protease ATP-binding subunit ClpC
MAPMFERFTDRARRAVVLAQEACRGSGAIAATELHVLWGLYEEGEGVAAKVLQHLLPPAVEVRVELCGSPSENGLGGHIPFSGDGKKVLELSLREALALGHNYIGTEHLLLAVVRLGNAAVTQFFAAHGVELPAVRKEVIHRITSTTGAQQQQSHVELLLRDELVRLDQAIAKGSIELEQLRANRQNVWDHLTALGTPEAGTA